MNWKDDDKAAKRFAAYVQGLSSVLGYIDRNGPLRDYCTGLILPGERKSVEPMAARTAPARTAAQHQSLLHFVGVATWSDEKVLAKVRELVLPAIEKDGPIEAWIIDDTGLPQTRNAFGRRAASILRSTGQAGQLSGGGVAVDFKSFRQPSGRLSAVPAGGLGQGSRAPQEGGRAFADQVQDQTGDRTRADTLGVRSRPAAWCRIDGRGLRQRLAAARGHDRS